MGEGKEIPCTVVEHVRINPMIKVSCALNGDEAYGTKSVDRIISYDILALPQLHEDKPNVVSEHDRALRRGADKSLARPTSRCRRTESIVSLERGVCSCDELQVFSCYRGRKEACQTTRAISTTWGRRRRKFTPF